jgi:hypothetical protein
MTKAVEVYLVGDEDSPKTNSWLAMTNSKTEALNLLETLEGACTYKSITVKEKPNAA